MSRFRVMIVDDDPDIRFVLRNLLLPSFEAVEAENGLDALEKVERYEPDLMLLDVMMPIMDGFRCCEGVRRHPRYHDMPVFFLSGFGDKGTYAEAYASGATAYIEKPIDTRNLIDLLETHFRQKSLSPVSKVFTLEELRVVDHTPLRPAEGERAEVPAPPDERPGVTPRELATRGLPTGAESAPFSKGDADSQGMKGRRRVFGRGAHEPTPSQPREKTGKAPSGAAPPGLPPVPPPPSVPPAAPGPSASPAVPPSPPEHTPLPLQPHYGRVEHPRPVMGLGRLRDRIPEGPATPSPGEKPQVLPAPAAAPLPSQPPVPPLLPREESISATPFSPASSSFAQVVSPAPAPPGPEAPTPRAPTPAPPASTAKPSPPRPSPPVHAPSPPKAQPSPLARVVVVNPDAREMIPFAEGIRGRAEFMPLEDPVQAIEHIARFQPDIVMSPLTMKGWDGLALIQMLRGNPRLAHIQVVLLADPMDDPTRRHLAELHSGHPLMTRPVTPEIVSVRIDQVKATPGFLVREKRATYGEFVRDVLRSIDQQKESRRKAKEQQAHLQHLAGWSQFLARELKDYRPPSGGVTGRSARDYYLS